MNNKALNYIKGDKQVIYIIDKSEKNRDIVNLVTVKV